MVLKGVQVHHYISVLFYVDLEMIQLLGCFYYVDLEIIKIIGGHTRVQDVYSAFMKIGENLPD